MKIFKIVFNDMIKNEGWRKAALSLLVAGVTYILMPASIGEPARRMSFIFVIAAFFWALEVVPLYTTSLIVVLLEIFLLCRPGGIMGMDAGGYKVFLIPFGSPIIMLFFGGLMMAAALHKYEIDNIIASRLLQHFGNKPYFIMLGFMITTAFLSMWMSNTATTAMMIAMVLPLLRQLDKKDPFRKGLVLSIPFAANIGGIGTPIGTPPNAIAIGILSDHGIRLDFLSWMLMAVPLASVLLLFVSGLLQFAFPPKNKAVNFNIPRKERYGKKSILTIVISIITVILWLTSSLHKIPSAIIALLAAGMFKSLKLLDQHDLKKIDWDVLVLMWGGLALGKGMGITGLTDWIVRLPVFNQQGLILVILFCFLAVVLSTFMSNTATANLLIPIVMMIPGESQIMLAITVALSCSFAMALPISTPPNAIAFATNMIRTKHMIRIGTIISLVSVLMIFLGFKFFITKAFHLG